MKFSPGKALLRDIIQFSHLAAKRIELSCLIDFYHRKNPYHCAHGQRLGIKVSLRFIVFVCTYIFAKSDLCGLANGLCIRILRSCYDMGSVFGEKNFDLFI